VTTSDNASRLLPSITIWLCVAAIGQTGAARGAASAPSADSSGAVLAEVIVTARKYEENTQSVPESVTVISADTIVNSHLIRLDDLNSLVSNLNIVERADNTPDVVLRGVGTFGVVQGIGFYVNDVQQFEGQTVRPEDIDHIEVLKGPQGTLYGGSNIGGAIKYVTKAPSDTFTGQVTLEGGNENQRTVSAALSGPLIPDRLNARLSVYSGRQDGFIDDTFLQRTLGKSDEQEGRLTVDYHDGPTKIVLYLSADRLSSQSENLYYTPPDDHTYLRTVRDGTVPYYRRKLYAPTLRIEEDLGGATFTSISSYFHSTVDSDTDLDKSPLPIADYIQNFQKRVLSEELRLASNDTSDLRWLLGAFAQGIDTNNVQITNVGLAAITGNQQDSQIIQRVPLLFDHEQRDYALFGNAIYQLSRWAFEGGLRVSHYRNTMNDTTMACGPCSAAAEGTVVLPKASISYQLAGDVLGYFSVARGFEAGDVNDEPDQNGNDVVHSYKPEHALSYELGMKSTLLDHRLRLNAAAFFIDYDNRLFEAAKITGAGIIQVEENIGASKNYGVELDATLRPVASLTLTTGLGVLRATWGNANFYDGVTNAIISLKGLSAPNAPEYQATLAADWRQTLAQGYVLGARIDARFTGRSWWDPQNYYQQRPYQIVNAGTWLEIGDHWRVSGHVCNVFDKRYNTAYYEGTEVGAPFNIAGINRPREWIVGISARY
jgi:iron complex outermembrane receptor protein